MPVNTTALFDALPQLAQLRDEIAPHYSAINYLDSNDDSWGSNATRVATIYTSADAHLDACLAHELLHLWLQAKGYRRLRLGISSFDATGWLGHFITAMDNELQHHRMFPRFVAMGFDPLYFYGSSDQHVADHLNAVLANPARDIKSIVLGYLTCIAPGGSLMLAQLAEFNHRFHEDRDGTYHVCLSEIDAAFAEWRAMVTLNAESIVRRIFLSLHKPTLTWFGYSAPAEFPANGFFIGDHFEMG